MSRTRYIVVPCGRGLYGVLDRIEDEWFADDLTRTEARQVVWERNGRHGGDLRMKAQRLREALAGDAE